MKIIKELNYLAEKITGTNPQTRTISKTIKYIADYLSQNK